MLLLEMSSKNEGTMWRWFLSLRILVALSLFGIVQCWASGEDLTTAHDTSTTNLALTQTITTSQAYTPTALQSEKMQRGEVYILQGCYKPNEARDVETILGADEAARNATGADGMSLAMCLDFCQSSAQPGIRSRGEQSLSLYVGLSDGR
jgi:hypothetical protein